MELVVYGVNHFNPLHRTPLSAWLAQELQARGVQPAFVAAEWSSESFMRIALVQRPRFRTACQGAWPGLSAADLEVLERSLAFEGDTHMEVCPGASLVWLDEPDANVANYAANRLALYQVFLQVHPPASDQHDVVERIAQRAREIDDEPVEPKRARDTKFAFAIHDAVDDHPGDWAVVVVGWSHALDEEGSMVRLLNLLGHDVHPYSMKGI